MTQTCPRCGQPLGDGEHVCLSAGTAAGGGMKIVAGESVTVIQHGPAKTIACDACGAIQSPESCFVCKRCGRTLCKRHLNIQHLVCESCAAIVEPSPAGAGALPAEAARALAGLTQPAPAFSARVWIQSGHAPATRDLITATRSAQDWRIGERFALRVLSDCDCYLTLLDVGTSGNVFLLLRNHPLRGGQQVSLHGPDASLDWVVSGPPGVERLKAFFTLQPLLLFPGIEPFSTLAGRGQTRDLVTRVADAGQRLAEMPRASWVDAECEFVVRGS